MRSRIAVLASGGGSNLQAILDHFDRIGEKRGGDVVLVASDRSDAGALERAARHGIIADVHSGPKRPDAATIGQLLEQHAIDLVVLSGYLKLIPSDVVAKYEGRIVNVHPSLLPAFGGLGMYGQRVHRAVIESGARVTGVTVHYADAVYDQGRIIAQWPVPVFASDDAGTLAARVLRVEHLVFPRVIDAIASGRTIYSAAVPTPDAIVDARPSFTLLSHEDSRLAENIELAFGC